MAMATLLAALSAPQLARLARGAALTALAIGVLGLVLSSLLSHALFGVGLCVGLTVALANFRVVAHPVAKAAAEGRQLQRPPAAHTLLRLGVISVVVLLLAWLVGAVGLGAIVGLAVFQFTLLAGVMLTLARAPALGDAEGGDR